MLRCCIFNFASDEVCRLAPEKIGDAWLQRVSGEHRVVWRRVCRRGANEHSDNAHMHQCDSWRIYKQRNVLRRRGVWISRTKRIDRRAVEYLQPTKCLEGHGSIWRASNEISHHVQRELCSVYWPRGDWLLCVWPSTERAVATRQLWGSRCWHSVCTHGAKQMMHTQETLPGRVCLYSWRYVEFLSKEYIYTLW